MRIAFSIILNGEHHLLHNNYGYELPKMVDLWVIAEGASGNTGSTKWCKSFPPEYHKDGSSIDNTRTIIADIISKNSNVFLVDEIGLWENKDIQVNTAMYNIKRLANKGFLFQIDIDEQWTLESMARAEQILKEKEAKTLRVRSNYYVGKNLIVEKGNWGGDFGGDRVWNWNGELFERHEGPMLVGGNGKWIGTQERLFNHYAYYFEQDVKFKDAWYNEHTNIYENWKELQKLKKEDFPKPISSLCKDFSKHGSVIFWKD